jgi:hypothetical protein
MKRRFFTASNTPGKGDSASSRGRCRGTEREQAAPHARKPARISGKPVYLDTPAARAFLGQFVAPP